MSILSLVRSRVFVVLLVLGAALAVAAACSDGDGGGQTPAAGQTPEAHEDESETGETPAASTSVDVALVEFAINPAQDTVDAGTVTFSVSNDGATPHNLRVVKTDLAPDALPKDGVLVDEGQVDVVVSTADLPGGATEEQSVDLAAGSYVLVCNIPGHYDLGMLTAFTVE